LGLDTLKVGYNAVHGYYIQISRGQSHLAPIHYVRGSGVLYVRGFPKWW
ncbi:hypothetical protein FK513_31270, partial [Klebsiella pneumoniae]|nr:hypothetical protein [Klebsiella pneumoniae]